MDRRRFLLTSLAGALAAPSVIAAQVRKVPRIGVLSPADAPNPGNDRFLRALRELGYVEGENIIIEYRSAQARLDRQTALVSELIRLPVDVLVVGTTGAALAAKRETATIPIVSASAGALVEAGVVASLARPGGNVTGLTTLVPELSAKRLELLKDAVPKLSRVAALAPASGRSPLSDISVKQTEAAARTVGVDLLLLRVEEPADLEAAFEAAARGYVDAVVLGASPLFTVQAARVAGLAIKHRLPMITGDPGVVEAGGLMAYKVDYPDLWRRAAGYVDKILKGAKPAELPIELPTKFELVINLKTAKALNLTIPPSLLARADQVIE